ncbi:MAG: C39 family peptidase [Bacteroidota bacterium]
MKQHLKTSANFMKINLQVILCFAALIMFANELLAQIYPDQHYLLRIDSLKTRVETSENVKLSDDGKSFVLTSNSIDGYVILKEQSSLFPFNQGLPSYNGTAPDENCGFKVQMRFPYAGSWSPWLTIGYWKNNIWSDYGVTSYAGGRINVDWAVLNSYVNKWQFKIILSRKNASLPSPSFYTLSMFVSDSKTTSNVSVSQLAADNPAEIFIPTTHIFQYGIDPAYGKDMCSPTTVSMILRSYNIAVDPFKFAWATYDTYHRMFGIWPRVVQNAAEYGLDGAVTRYRSWSQTREVLEKGGRIAMSVGLPISSVGHLLMLAGFTNDGKVIVHDPGKSSGQSYIYDKTSVTQAWFTKGGIAYTFYPAGSIVSVVGQSSEIPANFELYQNYPNPFNPTTTIRYQIANSGFVSLKVYDMLGKEIAVLVNETKYPGIYEVNFDASGFSSGVYVYRLHAGSQSQTKKLILMK